MARVLISFLGTGPFKVNEEGKREYEPANYYIDGVFYKTPFISAALAEHLQIEKRIIIGTAKSMWEEYYRYVMYNNPDYDESFYDKLVNYCKNANHLTTDFELIKELESRLTNTNITILKYGLDEEQLRFNIAQVLTIDQMLEKKDGVYVDVTHGFRSFPLLAQQIVFYLKEVSAKNVKFRNFYYGMLDAKKDLGYAPVVDLKIMFEMNDWILGANQFKVSMNGSKIVSLIKDKDEKLADVLDSFSKALNINYANEIQEQIKLLENFETTNIEYPEKLIVDKVINEFVSHFSNIEQQSKFQYELAKWYYSKYNFGNAYVILLEAIITLVCEILNIDPYQKEQREKAKYYLNTKFNKKDNPYFPLSSLYKKLILIRNNISHNLQKRVAKHLEDIDQLPVYFKLLKKYFK